MGAWRDVPRDRQRQPNDGPRLTQTPWERSAPRSIWLEFSGTRTSGGCWKAWRPIPKKSSPGAWTSLRRPSGRRSAPPTAWPECRRCTTRLRPGFPASGTHSTRPGRREARGRAAVIVLANGSFRVARPIGGNCRGQGPLVPFSVARRAHGPVVLPDRSCPLEQSGVG
jgi:hypothetical protein